MPPKAKKRKISKKTSFFNPFGPNLIIISFFNFFLIFLIFFHCPTKKFKSHLSNVIAPYTPISENLLMTSLLPGLPSLLHPNFSEFTYDITPAWLAHSTANTTDPACACDQSQAV